MTMGWLVGADFTMNASEIVSATARIMSSKAFINMAYWMIGKWKCTRNNCNKQAGEIRAVYCNNLQGEIVESEVWLTVKSS